MNNNYLKTSAFFLLSLLFVSLGLAQNQSSIWTKTTQQRALSGELALRKTQPSQAVYYELNLAALKVALQTAPNRKTFTGESSLILQFPNVNGKLESFRIKEAPIMEEALQVKFPDNRSYIGKSLENPLSVIRFSITGKGLHTMTLSEKSTQFIDPYTQDGKFYIVYSKTNLGQNPNDWSCDFDDEIHEIENNTSGETVANQNANDSTLREFRLALACTVEYSQFHGGTLTSVMDAMAVTMTRVNGIYEREISVTMLMVDNTDIIFLGPDVNSDPYTNNNGGAMLNQNVNTINAEIGFSNYDIGHVFSTGGGGIAALGSPCTGSKAAGVTGLPAPTGDAFDVDFVCHEFGHQYGAPHTFNGNAPGTSCLTQRTASNAYEPGSGSTIMGYAGICPPQNVQNNSDDYFHQISLEEMFDNITIGNSQCANTISISNSPPVADAGANFTIPQLTPYRLTGSATDDGGAAALTYTWEQYDLGPTGAPTEGTVQGPIVRSFKGTNNPTRYIPRLEDLVSSGGSTDWEKLSSVARPLNFRLTVRDNDPVGGQTDDDGMTATVVTTAGPFIVTSQNTEGISWESGTTETITWDVAGTTGNGINTSNVNIKLSVDGGLNYDIDLASNVPNDGSQDITVPDGIAAAFCRVMVEAVDNIFFNINTTDFAVNATVTTVCNVYTTGPISTAIPDSPGQQVQGPVIFVPINVTESTQVSDISVSVDVTHSYIGDLIMQLQEPNGSAFSSVWARNCNSTQFQDVNVTFKDGNPAIACASPTTGDFAPANPLSVFNGSNPSGTWNMAFVDFFNGDTGVVNEVSIELCTTTAVLGTDRFDIENSLSIYPNPNSGDFNVAFSTLSNRVEINMFDTLGRSVFESNYENVSGQFEKTISLGNVNSGMYLLNIDDGTTSVTKKIIIK
ncbi:MAG: reprolysin-like metallopeptidase [Bacteroidota bacterium]